MSAVAGTEPHSGAVQERITTREPGGANAGRPQVTVTGEVSPPTTATWLTAEGRGSIGQYALGVLACPP